MLNIAYILPGVGLSGGNNVIFEYAHRLMVRGHSVILLDCAGNGQAPNWHPIKGLRIFDLNDIWTLRYLASQTFDIVVATGWQTTLQIIRTELRARAFVYFVQCNEILFNPVGSWDQKLSGITYCLPFRFLTISRWLVNWLKTEYGQNAYYVPNRYNPEFVHKTEPLEPKSARLRILIEGPLSNPWKRMDDAFLAVQGLDAEIWCLSGAGQLKPWQRPDRFFNAVPYRDVKAIMSSCDVLLKMSEIEGFFGPPLEMMACGGTAVVTKVPGYDEYVIDNVNALTVEIGDYRSARDKLGLLIEDRVLLKHLIKGGGETARKFSNWEESVDEVEQFFIAVSHDGQGTAPRALGIPGRLKNIVDLALDVCFSRHSDDPAANRRNWLTLGSFHSVKLEQDNTQALVTFRGWSLDEVRQCELDYVRVAGAANADAISRPSSSRADVTADHGIAGNVNCTFEVKGVVPVGNEFSELLGENVADQWRGSVVSVEGVDIAGRVSRIPFVGETPEWTNGIRGCVENLVVLKCYRVSVNIAPETWPDNQGNNYAIVLGFFCNKVPQNIVLFSPVSMNSLCYPPMHVEQVNDGSGRLYVLIDTISVYSGKPAYDFLMFVDPEVKAFAAAAHPGALR